MADKTEAGHDGVASILFSLFKGAEAQYSVKGFLSLLVATEDNLLSWIEDKKQILVLPLKDVVQKGARPVPTYQVGL